MSFEKSSEQKQTNQVVTTSINQKDAEGNTKLHLAVLNNSEIFLRKEPDFESISNLLSDGADITIPNKHGLYAHELIFSGSSHTNIDREPSYRNLDRVLSGKNRYFDLIIEHQPTFENIKFLIENEFIDISHIKVAKLSQECLEKLIDQCTKWDKIYLAQQKPGQFSPESWAIYKTLFFTGIPTFMHQAKGLLEKCQQELHLLKQYPDLQEPIEIMTRECYREAVITALMQDKDIKELFDQLLAQLKLLPLSGPVHDSIINLSRDLEAHMRKNYPVFIELNAKGKEFIDNLFDQLHCALFERQHQADIQKTQKSGRWTIGPNELQKRFEDHKSSHQVKYKAVLEQHANYQARGGFFAEGSLFSVEMKRNKLARAALKRQQSENTQTTTANLDPNLITTTTSIKPRGQ